MPRFRCAPLNPCRRSPVAWSVWTLLFAAALASGPSSEPIDLGSRLEPLVDRFLIQSLSGDARLQLHQPQRREVVLVHDVPWEGNLTAHHTLFRDGDRYRMYYGGRHYQPGQKVRHVLVCYAESRDGIHWTRPNLGQFEYEGSRANNIVWMDDPWADSEQRNPMAVFKDSNPAAAPDARYKSIARGDDGVYALKSPDGIHWSLLAQEPVIPKGDMGLDSQNLAFWDGLRGRYVCYLRSGRTHPTGQRVRDVKTAVSHDFLTWTEPVFLEYPGAPVEHLYTNQIRPYARAPHIYLGFPKRFVPERNQDRKLSGVSDGVFMSSRDGVRFHRWGEAVVRPGLQPERWMTRNNMIGWGILSLPSSVAGEPDELSIYVTESYYSGPASRLRRYTYRLDGFVSLRAPLAGGGMTTRPIRFRGSRLVLNCSTSAAGSLRVEIQDEAGRPIPGYSLQDSREIFGDSVEQAVSWKRTSDLSSLSGKTVRLRYLLKDADLYALQFLP